MFIYRLFERREDALIQGIWVHGSTFTIFIDSINHKAINKFVTKFERANSRICSVIVRGEGNYHDNIAHDYMYRGSDVLYRVPEHFHFDFNHFVTSENINQFLSAFIREFPGSLSTAEITDIVNAFNRYENSIPEMRDMLDQYQVVVGSIYSEDPYIYTKCPVTQRNVTEQPQLSNAERENKEKTTEFRNLTTHLIAFKKLEELFKENEEKDKQDQASQIRRLHQIREICQESMGHPDASSASAITTYINTPDRKQIHAEVAAVMRFHTFHELEQIFLKKAEFMLHSFKAENKTNAASTSTVLVRLGGPGDAKQKQEKSATVAAPSPVAIVHASSSLLSQQRKRSDGDNEDLQTGCLERCNVM